MRRQICRRLVVNHASRVRAASLLAVLIAGAGCGDDRRDREVLALQEEIRQLRAQTEILASEATSARRPAPERDSRLSAEVADLRNRLTEITKTAEIAEGLAEQRQTMLEATDRQLQGAQAEVARLNGALETTIHEANAAAERYERELASLRAQVADLTARLDKAVKALGEDGLRRVLPPP
jgi:chromosome segregation ATPase